MVIAALSFRRVAMLLWIGLVFSGSAGVALSHRLICTLARHHLHFGFPEVCAVCVCLTGCVPFRGRAFGVRRCLGSPHCFSGVGTMAVRFRHKRAGNGGVELRPFCQCGHDRGHHGAILFAETIRIGCGHIRFIGARTLFRLRLFA